MRLSLKSVKKPQSLARARKGVSGPFFRSGECCFHHPVKESCFYLHLSRHRVALSDVPVLCNRLCSIGEYHGLVVSARPAPSYQSFSPPPLPILTAPVFSTP